MPTMIGEIAAVVTDGQPAHGSDATRLVMGYAGEPRVAWVDGPVALAASGSADIAVADDLIVLIDGRLDNRAELIRRFGGSTVESPARLLMSAWRRVGRDMVDEVVGEIAGIVYDRRTRQLHAFRDLCAGPPLHVSRLRDSWAVASDWQPLVSAGSFHNRPDPEWFAGACAGAAVNPRATPYVGVEMVMPGHVATPTARSWHQKQHANWHIERLDDRRPGVYREQFLELFDQAVRCRLMDPSGIGVSLSGGLDSTSVMATASEVAPDVPRTALCMPMLEPEGDERKVQAQVAERAAARLQWVDISRCGPMGPDGPEAVFERHGGPPGIINWSLAHAVAESAADAGLHVALDGEDADSLLEGHSGFFPDLLVRGRFATCFREWKALREADVTGGRQLGLLSTYFLAPPVLRRLYHRAKRVQETPDFLPAALSSRLELERKLYYASVRRVWAPGRTFQALQRTAGDPEYLGPMLTQISYPWRLRGIAISHPFTDRRLMSFCMGLPYEHVYQAGWGKLILRHAMADRLPDQVILKSLKANLSEVARRAAYGRDLKYVKAGLAFAREQTDWFDSKAVGELESSFLAQHDNLGVTLRVSMLGWWLRWCEAA